jgi:hypothetical protein
MSVWAHTVATMNLFVYTHLAITGYTFRFGGVVPTVVVSHEASGSRWGVTLLHCLDNCLVARSIGLRFFGQPLPLQNDFDEGVEVRKESVYVCETVENYN